MGVFPYLWRQDVSIIVACDFLDENQVLAVDDNSRRAVFTVVEWWIIGPFSDYFYLQWYMVVAAIALQIRGIIK